MSGLLTKDQNYLKSFWTMVLFGIIILLYIYCLPLITSVFCEKHIKPELSTLIKPSFDAQKIVDIKDDDKITEGFDNQLKCEWKILRFHLPTLIGAPAGT